jgi:predicted GH43/DUF377 family glycosyl hydrolase
LDPIRNKLVKWEGKDVFNPASLVKDGEVIMLYRAEDFIGKYNGTSRIGLARSQDGVTFKRDEKPVFYPDNDDFKYLEWEGGAEDPRIVEDENGRYIMTYTAYDGETARLLIATSDDLYKWQKYGSVFTKVHDANKWSKSGAIVCKLIGERMVATKINGKYWMYFGDTSLFVAYSDDLISWTPVYDKEDSWAKVLSPRPKMFDSRLVECGPPAILTKNGILVLYNSMNLDVDGDPDLPPGNYAAGQALFSNEDPSKLINRSSTYFFTPTKDYEMTGQINNVCFIEGLSYFKNKWYLYYGPADSKIAVAVSTAELDVQ